MNPPGIARDDRTLAVAAAACAALVFVVVASSAWLRLAAAACPPPGCEAFALADAVRIAHRVAAMGVSILALVIAALAWKAPARAGRRAAAAAVLVLVAALAIIGRRSAGSAPPAVLLANLLGGLTLLAFAAGLAAAARAPRGRVALPVSAAALLLAAATATGGVLATLAPAESSGLGLAHRALSWAAVAAWGLVAIKATPPPGARPAAGLTAGLLAAQALLAIAFPGWPLARWLHNLLASAALICAIAAVFASRAPSRPEPGLPERAPAGP